MNIVKIANVHLISKFIICSQTEIISNFGANFRNEQAYTKSCHPQYY